ncbi:E3 ubiquitin-protein ligase mib1, partial [Exophiala xenobiotica]
MEDGQLVLNDPRLILNISNKLEGEAQGMFLWVRLFINDLCAQKSDNDILAALQGPPPSISLLIDKTIDRIQQCASSKDVLKLLQFCGILKRSLTVEEFRELLSFTTNQRARDIGQMIHDVGEIVAETGGLVYIDEEEQTVHYVHQSVKNHLFGRSPHRDGFCTTELDLHLGFLILIYLNFNDFKRSLVKVDSGSTTSFRPVDIAVSSVSGSNSQVLRTAARKLLRNRQNLQSLKGKDLERKIRDTVGTGDLSTNQLESQYPFLEYAKSYWLDHLEEIEPESDARIWRLFDTLVKGENGLISTPWNAGRVVSRVAYEKTKQTLEWALSNQKPALVMYELVHNIDTVRESDQQQILSIASGKALFRLMSVLIRKQTPS